ncbi:hypothetical protein QO002_004671 [Pararhizobium capsulatum DSM 1112]|uniref:Uncharacterized protein n=1 Tax=Pararhizobium capsulatum DSM 1112 TaxID=1121113 RepID=A0ABU0BW28_9HYPH|nr:hypothetical protein [Pararhizobium capsulatum]MDQ0322465.1 hypothetical protein [Pararhizobium capsulatum DSM 1112]
MQRLKVTYRLEAFADLKQINIDIALLSQSRALAIWIPERIMACGKIGDAPHGRCPG